MLFNIVFHYCTKTSTRINVLVIIIILFSTVFFYYLQVLHLFLYTSFKSTHVEPKNIEKPKAIVGYNKSKAYIDLSDQMKAYSHCLRRGTKWYRKLAIELILGSALINSFLVYKEVTQNKIQITEYKELLAMTLLGQDKSGQLDSDEGEQNLEHILQEAKKSRCVTCYAKVKEVHGRIAAQRKCSRTKWQCIACGKYYCVSCFFTVHKATK